MAEPDWSLFWMVSMGMTGALTAASLLVNSVVIVTVFRLAPMRRSGYFQVTVAFALANMLYYAVILGHRGLLALTHFSLVPGGVKADFFKTFEFCCVIFREVIPYSTQRIKFRGCL